MDVIVERCPRSRLLGTEHGSLLNTHLMYDPISVFGFDVQVCIYVYPRICVYTYVTVWGGRLRAGTSIWAPSLTKLLSFLICGLGLVMLPQEDERLWCVKHLAEYLVLSP